MLYPETRDQLIFVSGWHTKFVTFNVSISSSYKISNHTKQMPVDRRGYKHKRRLAVPYLQLCSIAIASDWQPVLELADKGRPAGSHML